MGFVCMQLCPLLPLIWEFISSLVWVYMGGIKLYSFSFRVGLSHKILVLFTVAIFGNVKC